MLTILFNQPIMIDTGDAPQKLTIKGLSIFVPVRFRRLLYQMSYHDRSQGLDSNQLHIVFEVTGSSASDLFILITARE